MSDFIPGLALAEAFYREAARSIIEADFSTDLLSKVEPCRTLRALYEW